MDERFHGWLAWKVQRSVWHHEDFSGSWWNLHDWKRADKYLKKIVKWSSERKNIKISKRVFLKYLYNFKNTCYFIKNGFRKYAYFQSNNQLVFSSL